jgi:hypothetical protein
MKTGRPECYIPSAETLSRDAKTVFMNVRERIAKMLNVSLQDDADNVTYQIWQEFDSRLSFATNAWTSPNHKAYVALTIHLEQDRKPLSMLLDLVEVPKSHTGVNLALVFAGVLQAFGIREKV